MKRIFILSAVFALFTYSLFAQELDPTLVKKKQIMPETQNHSFLTQEYVGSSITVTGLLTVNKKTFTLKENPDSKSVVTFKLEVKKWCLKRKLKKLNGNTITLSGILTDASSTWHKKMKVLKIN